MLVAVGSNDNHLYIWDAFTGVEVGKFKTDGGVNSSPAFYKEGERLLVAVGSDDHRLYVYNLSQTFLEEGLED